MATMNGVVLPGDSTVRHVEAAVLEQRHGAVRSGPGGRYRGRDVMATMNRVVLPGDSTVRRVEAAVPEPGHSQVLLQMKASSICGSDIRAIYRERLDTGPEAYRRVIAGHEPCGQVVAVGTGCRRLSVGDRGVDRKSVG